MSEHNSENHIYTWLGAQSLPIQFLLGPPIVIFGTLYGFAVFGYVIFVLVLLSMIANIPRKWAFRRSMKRDLRVVEWRHVRSQLLANPDDGLLVEFKGDGYAWCCPHVCCRHFPRFDNFWEDGTSVFYGSWRDDYLKLKHHAALQCIQNGKVLLTVSPDAILNDSRLPRDRVHVIYGSVRLIAALRSDENGHGRRAG